MSIPTFKLVVIGGESVGKTSLISRLQRKNFSENVQSSSAVTNDDKTIKLQGIDQNVNLEVYDVPGAEKFVVLNRMYLRDTNAALIVYDVDSKESLTQAETWVEELKEYAPSEVVVSLAGNKSEIPGAHAVNMQEGQSFARKHKINVCKEVSAKTNEGVDALFHAVAVQCWDSKDNFVSEI